MTTKPREYTKIFMLTLPESLHAALKHAAIDSQVSMQQFVKDAIRAAIGKL